ncbi:ABC transporter permease [Mesorhizobium sp. M0621]|uniref:ABC transporter permease n=1 Tax=Mesorhizobium sp. M0621 TaxID=2956974 RepID=UPI00333C95F2
MSSSQSKALDDNLAAPAPTIESQTGNVRRETRLSRASRHGLLASLFVLVAVSEYLYPGFLMPQNIRNILGQSAPTGIVAVGMTFVMITGGFDLSVGSIYAAGATIYASLAVAGWPLPEAAVATIAIGFLAGLTNGLIVTKLNVNAFVATLGTMSAFSGLALIYSNSSPFIAPDPAFAELGRGHMLSIPISIWILLAFLVAGQLVLSRTVYGRQLYAIGGNDEASRLAGLRTEALRTSAYALSGACAAIAGMLIASRLGMGQADIGAAMALDAIAVVVIGGTSLLGGEGSIWRTAIGLLIVAVLTNLLDSLAISSHYQLVIKGTIVIGAVAVDSLIRSRR